MHWNHDYSLLSKTAPFIALSYQKLFIFNNCRHSSNSLCRSVDVTPSNLTSVWFSIPLSYVMNSPIYTSVQNNYFSKCFSWFKFLMEEYHIHNKWLSKLDVLYEIIMGWTENKRKTTNYSSNYTTPGTKEELHCPL